jgi:hypothetical protein
MIEGLRKGAWREQIRSACGAELKALRLLRSCYPREGQGFEAEE